MRLATKVLSLPQQRNVHLNFSTRITNSGHEIHTLFIFQNIHANMLKS